MNKLFPGLLILLAPVILGGVCQVAASASCETGDVVEYFVTPQTRGTVFPVTTIVPPAPMGAIVEVDVVDGHGGVWKSDRQVSLGHPLAFTNYARELTIGETSLRAVVLVDDGGHITTTWSRAEPLTVLP